MDERDYKAMNEELKQPFLLGAVSGSTDLEWSPYKQVVQLKEQVRKLEFKEYFNSIMKEVDGLMFANETYIRLLFNEGVPIDRAIIAIIKGNE